MVADPLTSPPGRHRSPWWLKLLLVVITFPVAFYLGALTEYHQGVNWDQALAPIFFGQTTKGFNTSTLDEVWRKMQRFYARTDISSQAALDGASKGLVQSLNTQFGDRFSAYMTPDEIKRSREFLRGSFGGIGASMLQQNNQLVISAVLPGTPAEKAGLKARDIVVKVDGKDVAGQSVDAVVGKVRGEAGTHVRLTIVRAGASREFDLVRADIKVPSVRSKEIARGVIYVRIYEFGVNTSNELETALKEGFAKGDTKVVLDLRQNPGGYVDQADAVTSEFVKSGLNVSLVGRNGAREDHPVSGKGIAFTQQLVVLIDDQSASASEIVAGALVDHQRAYLVGQKTFGKGSVQQDFELRNNGDLHLTIAYWYRPSGKSIERVGIAPDQMVALAAPADFYEVDQPDSDPARDTQLQAALQHLR